MAGNDKESERLAKEALDKKIDSYEAIMKGCAEGMKAVSDKYENGEYYVPEVLVSARAMKRAVDVLQPHIKVEGTEVPGKVMLGVVDGDVHDIGRIL